MEAGIGGHRMKTRRTKIAQSQIDYESIGRRPKSFKSEKKYRAPRHSTSDSSFVLKAGS